MISLFFLGFLLLSVLWDLYYSMHWSKDLSVSLNFLQNYVYTGEQAQMTERIENRKRLMLPVLEVAFHVDRRLSFHDSENTNVSDFVYKRDIFALLGRQRVTRKLTLDCTQRGYYRISESYLASFSMLHTKRYSAACPADTELYVYAARTDVSDILVACERLMGNLQCAKRLYEDPFAFASIREYTSADSMNTINWKASARTGGLMVNTFESTLTESVMLYLDVEDRGILKYDLLVEESVSVAASLAQRLIARGMEVGLCVNAGCRGNAEDRDASGNAPRTVRLAPAGGKRHLDAIEQLLAKCKSDENTVPFADLLGELRDDAQARRRPDSFSELQDTMLIFISKNTARSQAAIEAFVGKDRQAVLVVPYMRNEPCELRVPDNIRPIKREVERS